MKIVRFTANDVLRLQAVDISPEGNVVTLGGKNGAGKSSCLNAIEMAIVGKKATPGRPIRDGADRAEIVIDLGELVVERVITETSDRLIVKSATGEVQPRPQEILNKLFTTIAFDPLRFAMQPAGAQAETLRQLAGLDLSQIEADRKAAFESRTDVNRDLKRDRARLDAMPFNHEVPAEEVSVAALGEELARRQEQVRERDRRRQVMRSKIEDVTRRIGETDRAKARIAAMESELAKAKDQLLADEAAVEDAKAEARRLKAEADAFVVQDPDEIQMQLASAELVNRAVRENRSRAEIEKTVAELQSSVDDYTAQIEALDLAKHRAITEATFPVPGLSLTDDGVVFNGIPFAQASRAEQLRVSLAVGMAMNPELRVLFVRDGSLLDEDSLRLVAELAAEHDCQVWLEDARTTDPTAVIIEDGQVSRASGSAPPAPAALTPKAKRRGGGGRGGPGDDELPFK
jgi:energy-coupling factor transporter ATP-binding protein EcfA2